MRCVDGEGGGAGDEGWDDKEFGDGGMHSRDCVEGITRNSMVLREYDWLRKMTTLG